MVIHNTIHTRHFNAQAQRLGYPDFLTALPLIYNTGKTLKETAALLGMDEITVLTYLQKIGIPRRPQGGWRGNRPQIVIEYQGKTWTTSELGRAMGTSREVMYHKICTGKLPGARYEKRIAT